MIDQEKLESHWHLLATEGPKTVGVTSEFNPLKCPPSWYDAERFRNAQLLAKKYYLSLNIAHFIGNILLVHLPDVLIPVLASGHSASPYMAFMRILSTVVHILSWYEEDPVSSLLLPLLQVVDSCYLKLPFSVWPDHQNAQIPVNCATELPHGRHENDGKSNYTFKSNQILIQPLEQQVSSNW